MISFAFNLDFISEILGSALATGLLHYSFSKNQNPEQSPEIEFFRL